jgi:transcriptional regulator with XRE-family HTH domain
MNHAAQRRGESEVESVRVLGRGLRAQRGVHLTMRTLREAAGKTQIDVAAASQINQADVSRLESREDFEDYQVSTLRRYLAALGGQLEIVGAFGNKRIVISGVRAEPSAASPANRALQPTSRKARRSKSTRAKPARG